MLNLVVWLFLGLASLLWWFWLDRLMLIHFVALIVAAAFTAVSVFDALYGNIENSN